MKKACKNLLERLSFQFLVLCIALYSPANFAQQNVVAGKILAVSGSVTALDVTGQTRPLQRHSEVYIGDTVVTGPRGFTQIRMTDDAIVALKEATRFQITEYSYADPAQADVSTLRLIEGGFRTITGNIGEQNRDAYNVETDFATIGIRGTDHEGVIDGGVLYTGVYDGGTEVENGGGTLFLGLGADYDFGQVDDANTPPVGLTLQPETLGNIPILNIDEPEEEDGDDDGGDGDADGGDADGGDADGGDADGGD
ncbi:MAG: FecR domain-containing protein, partial [Pseudohongiellaceae bacterium]